MKKCPNCSSEWADDLKFCENCGVKLIDDNSFQIDTTDSNEPQKDEIEKQTESITQLESIENLDKVICPNCSHPNDDDGLFCELCGTSLTETETVPSVENSICPTCHSPNEIGSDFCEKCGTKLSKSTDDSEQIDVYENDTKNQTQDTHLQAENSHSSNEDSNSNILLQNTETLPPPIPTKRTTKKQKALIGIVIVLLLILVGSFIFAKNYYSKTKQIDRFLVTFNKKDPAQLAKIITSDDPNYKISKEKLTIYTDYLTKHPKYATDIATDIKSKQSLTSDIQVVDKGKYLGVFPKYEFVLKPIYRSLITNKKGVAIYINDKEIIQSDSDNFQYDTKALTPGDYKISGKLKVGDKEEVTENKYKLVRFKNTKFEDEDEIDLSIEQVKFKVTSNVEQADIYVDNNKIRILENSEAIIGPLVWHKDMTVKLVQNFADGKEESKPFNIKRSIYSEESFEDTDDIYLTLDTGLNKNDIQFFLDKLYSDVTNYTDEYYDFGETEKEHFATYFVNGRNNFDYQDFTVEFISKIRKSPYKTATRGNAIVENITRTDRAKYEVQYKIIYTTIYHDKPSLEEVFRYTKATFIQSDENDIQIDNLGGKDNFETVS